MIYLNAMVFPCTFCLKTEFFLFRNFTINAKQFFEKTPSPTDQPFSSYWLFFKHSLFTINNTKYVPK